MNTSGSTNPYTHHRFPAEIISHGVWLYCRFCLSYRDVEERLFARGVLVTYEAIRQWCRKFGQQYAHQLRRQRPRPGGTWHLDEGFLTIQQDILPGVAHRQHRYLNNRTENSHQPTRQRERRLQGCKSPGPAPRVLAAYGPMAQHFRPRRHRVSASASRQEIQQRFQRWGEITGTGGAASAPRWSKASPLSSLCGPQTRSARIS
jgi:putative transposase